MAKSIGNITMNVVGRPTDYSQELIGQICERIGNGESLRSICLDPNMPAQATIYRWLVDERYKEFREQYALARETQADTIFDEMVDIADDGSNDWMERKGEDGQTIGWRENGEAISRSRLRVDTRKWMAGKLRPKKYGEKVINELTGANGGAIETTSTSDRELSKAILSILGASVIAKS